MTKKLCIHEWVEDEMFVSGAVIMVTGSPNDLGQESRCVCRTCGAVRYGRIKDLGSYWIDRMNQPLKEVEKEWVDGFISEIPSGYHYLEDELSALFVSHRTAVRKEVAEEMLNTILNQFRTGLVAGSTYTWVMNERLDKIIEKLRKKYLGGGEERKK